MKRILFVDDERNVLDGLRRMLRPMRDEWEMRFCESARDALATVEEEPFDVVVSDMRMPGMDGAALFAELSRRHPEIVRIVLSGHSSRETTLKSVGVAHQFLAKPCDTEALKSTIDHAFALRNLLASDALRQALSKMVSVPSMPAIYRELMEELGDPDTTTSRIGQIVARDVGMTTKILQLVNSAFFGLARRVSDTTQATALLGMETIKALVLTLQIFSQFDCRDVDGVDPRRIQRHSTSTAAIAKRIGQLEKAPPETINASLMAGFLHDVGKLILAQNLREEYRDVVRATRERAVALCVAEREAFGATHAEVGAYLLGLWGLPEPIVEASAFHHCPSASCGKDFSPLTAVHVANVLANESETAGSGDMPMELDQAYLEQVGASERLTAWRDAARDVIEQSGGGL